MQNIINFFSEHTHTAVVLVIVIFFIFKRILSPDKVLLSGKNREEDKKNR